ncbi:MAG TPA: AI-2E family transporter [Acidimicrobiia bacterium]|nr:AI-2E family transporter [Acidimicrobiia bacterium]
MPSDRLQRLALTVWTIVGALALGYVFLFIAGQVRVIWLPIAFAAGLVFLLEPMVRIFQRMRTPRILAVFLAFAVLVALIVAVIALVLPTIRVQADELGEQLPDLYLSGIDWARAAGARLGVDVDELLSQQAIEDWLNDPANQDTVQNLLLGFGAGAGQLIRGVTEAIAVLVLAPVLAIYILIDLERFKVNSLGITPPRHREETAYVAGQVSTAMGSFVRGQLLVSFIVGVASSFGMWLIDLPFWLIIGILAGFLNLIPFLGPVVGGALAVLVALLNGDPGQAIWAVLIFVGIQQVDNHVITPLVQRARVNLSPLVIVLALIIGGSVAGLLGVLVAVPMTAAIRIIVGHLWRTRVLGETWGEASRHMIEFTEPPERIVGIRRRHPDQTRLFDTQEIRAITEELAEDPAHET